MSSTKIIDPDQALELIEENRIEADQHVKANERLSNTEAVALADKLNDARLKCIFTDRGVVTIRGVWVKLNSVEEAYKYMDTIERASNFKVITSESRTSISRHVEGIEGAEEWIGDDRALTCHFD